MKLTLGGPTPSKTIGRMKGSAFLALERVVRRRGTDLERRWLAAVPPAERIIYQAGNSSKWYPCPGGPPNGVTEAGKLLFPGDPEGLRRLGKLTAPESVFGIYNVLVHVTSITYFLKCGSFVWNLFHDVGKASIADIERTQAVFILQQLPGLPDWFRMFISGFIEGVLEEVGARDVRVTHLAGDPQAWAWELKWS